MFRRTRAVAAAAVLALAAAGCADESPEQSTEDLDDQQTRVLAEMRDAVDAVEDAGLTVEEAAGIAEYCQMPPDPGATYRAGGRVAEDGDPAAQVATIRDALVDLGWTLETEDDSPEPYANLTRDDLRASVSVSRSQVDPGVTFGVTAPCLSVNDDFSLADDNYRVSVVE